MAISEAASLLQTQGMDYAAVVRTWFYLDGILDWYDEFNQARSAAYRDFGLGNGPDGEARHYPASTGVGARASGGNACTLDLVAVKADSRVVAPVRFVSSATQPDAWRYGSAFSRGAAVDLPDCSLIQVSGTAAIGEDGRTLSPGDARSQITRTLDAVESLLAQEEACLQDACAATAFLKHRVDAGVLREVLASRRLEGLPVVCVVADICRDDLLFELDAEVMAERPRRAIPS
jgi:enamine deaminase RidA (YjgF/YER057c/UK114 family)